MALLTQRELHEIIDQGIIDASHDNVNGSSIDIVLGPKLLIEKIPKLRCPRCKNILLNTTYEFDRMCLIAYKDYNLSPIRCNKCYNTTDVEYWVEPIDPSNKENISFDIIDCTDGHILRPGDVCLASTVETYNMPDWLTAEYRLKSSMARVFLEHLHAGWVDPWFSNAQLTLEFANMSKWHSIKLTAGMKCGQVMFYSGEPVPEESSYAVKGQYNNSKGPTASSGVK